MNIIGHFLKTFHLFPDRIAISKDNDFITYRTLHEKSLKIGFYLRNRNITDSCIAIEIADSIEHIIVILGIVMSGNYYVSVTDENKPFFSAENKLPIKLVFCHGVSSIGYETVATPNIFGQKIVSNSIFGTDIKPDSKICAFFTSGSTGESKIIVHNHATIYTEALQEIGENKIVCTDKLDLVFSVSFSASLSCIFPSLLAGAELCIFDLKESGLHLLTQFWKQKSITYTTLAVSTFQAVCKMLPNLYHFKALRFIGLSAEPVKDTTIAFFHAKCLPFVVLQIAYASTETRTISDIKFFNDGQPDVYAESIGKPVIGKRVFIVDETGQEQMAGNIGEIIVESQFIADAYYGQPKKSWDTFSQIGNSIQYKTGDLGYLNADGYLFYTGRKKNEIKINGIKINIVNIEAEIEKVNGILQAIVVINTTNASQPKLVCFFKTNQFPVSDVDIKQAIVTKLPSSHIPHFFFGVDSFPLTHSGKIDRKNLEKISIDDFLKNSIVTAGNLTQQNSDFENSIIDIFKVYLGVEKIDADSDFFELGGDSITCLLCVAEIESRLNIKVQSFAFITNPTPRKLSLYLTQLKPEEVKLVMSLELNGFSETRRNLYIFNKYQSFLDSSLSANFNLICLYYDIDNGYKIENADQLVINQLVDIIAPHKNSIIMGFSFDGYMAHQLACILPQIAYCVLIDTANYFEFSKYSLTNYKSAMGTLFWQMTANKDYSFPLFLAKSFYQKQLKRFARKPKTEIDHHSNGIDYYLEKIKNKSAINNCIYFQANRSCNQHINHGIGWKSYIAGNFHFVNLPSEHGNILQKHAFNMANYINEIALND